MDTFPEDFKLLQELNSLLVVSENADLFEARGVILARMGNGKEALRDFSRALQLGKKTSWKYRGEVYFALGKYEAALEDFDLYLTDHKHDAAAFRYRAEVKQTQADWAGAIEDYTASLGVEPGSASTLASLGQIFFELGYYKRAMEFFDQALALDDEYPEAHLGRGQVLFEMGLYQEATAEFQLVLRIRPKDETAADYFSNSMVLLNQRSPHS